MPRTKVVKKKAIEKMSPFAKEAYTMIENMRSIICQNIKHEINNFKGQLDNELKKSKLSIPQKLLNKTLAELMENPLGWTGNSTEASVVINATNTMMSSRQLFRSSSVGDDEGYLTAESSKSTSGGRHSRTRSRLQKTTRISRSQSVRSKNVATTDNRYKTPAQKIPKTSYGTVTPKMKPNTPQVLLRRPKQGEVALSLQGSPLLTGSVMTDNVANINIPLDDGRLLSIQPQKGLRISQIPQLDVETKRQLETLRDNLNKVCALASTR